jgi:hypothetical protein
MNGHQSFDEKQPPQHMNFTRQNRHYRNTKATGLFGNIGIECLVRFEVNFFHTLPQKPLKLVPFRSDTFVVRVCGEAQDASGKITARAYAEAVVQRVPEYVDPVDRPSVNAYDITLPTAVPSTASPANKAFGRRMNVVSFRWSSSNEI